MIGDFDWLAESQRRHRENERRAWACALALLTTCAVIGALIWGLP